MVFYDLGLLHFEEPFPKFRAHGLLIKDGAKMSKSKGNIVNPDEYIKKFGADAFRMYLMFLAPFEQGGDFRDAGILGIVRFLERIWKLAGKFLKDSKKNKKSKINSKDLEKILHKTVKKVTEDIEILHYNTAISALMVFLNEMEKNYNLLTKNYWSTFLKLLAPFAPYLAEELWHSFGNKGSVHKASWPQYDYKFIEEETFVLIIQINGRVRDQIEVQKNLSQKEIEELVFNRERVKMFLRGQKPKRIVLVPGRLINIVV
jgi:leucyl-tRNA synthetase